MKVTDEHVHDDCRMVPELVENLIDSDSITAIGKIFGDDAYDNNDAFGYPSDNRILACIIVRKNAKVRCIKGISLGIYQFCNKEIMCKDGKIA